MDSKKLHVDILAHLSSDPVAQKHIGIISNLRWTQSDDGFLQHDNWIYVPEAENLWLQVLQYKHDHILSGHFSQNKTLWLICCEYTWPGLQTFVNDFCKSCTTCMRSKSQHYKPYGYISPIDRHPDDYLPPEAADWPVEKGEERGKEKRGVPSLQNVNPLRYGCTWYQILVYKSSHNFLKKTKSELGKLIS